MSADLDEFEQTRLQFANSLAALAENLRQCSHMADQMAHFIGSGQHIPLPPPQPLPHGLMPPPVMVNPAVNGHQKRKASVLDEEEEGGKKRRTRKLKDPNAPKRPPSSYIMFQNEVRGTIKAQNPNIQNHELLQVISHQWANMTPEQKAVYTNAMAKAKETYTNEKAAYDARSPEEKAAADAAAAAKPARKSRKTQNNSSKSDPAPSVPAVTAQPPSRVAAPSSSDSDDDDDDDDGESSGSGSGGSDEENDEDVDDGDDDDEEEEEAAPPPPSDPKPKKSKKSIAEDVQKSKKLKK